MTPFSTSTEADGDVVRVSVLLSADDGLVREFRPYLDVELDETHALILFGELGLALQAVRDRRTRQPANDVVPHDPRSRRESLRAIPVEPPVSPAEE